MFRLLSVIIVFLIVCASSAGVLARENTDVKTTQNNKYIRLFFYCKQPVKFNTSLNGNKLKISFGRDVEINSTPIESLGNDISNVTFNKENNTATLTLANNSYGVRKFIGEDFIGIDIIKPEKTASSTTDIIEKAEEKLSSEEPEITKQAESLNRDVSELADIEPAAGEPKSIENMAKPYAVKPDAIKAEVVKLAEESNEPLKQNFIPIPKLRQEKQDNSLVQISANTIETQDTYEKIQEKTKELKTPEKIAAIAPQYPSATKPSEESKPTTPEPEKNEVIAAKPDVALPQTQNKEIIAKKANNPAELTAPKNTSPTVAVQASPPPPPLVSEQNNDVTEKTPDNETLAETPAVAKVSVAETMKDKLLSKLVFEWDEPIAASAFKRAGYLWLVFDKAKEINVANLINKNSGYFLGGSQMPNRFYTIIRLKLKKDINTVLYKENNNWVLGITNEKIQPAQLSKIEMKFSDLTGSKVLLDNDTPLKPLRLIDPEVGDEIIILPYLEESTGIKEKYKYIDFAFLETSQGAVIQLISDKVEVAVIETGISVIGHANIIDNAAQSALKALKEKEAAAIEADKLKQGAELTLLKFNTWALGGDSSYKKDLKDLEWKIAEVDWSEKSKHRLALARFYLAHNMSTEALGVIKILREYDEKSAKENDVKIVEATALYMMGRYKEAIDIYDTINTDSMTSSNKSEILFWRTASDINISNEIKLDKFITKNPLDKKDKDEEEGSGDKVENTKLMHDTSMRLLKMIRKMDPDFVNADELQKLESTARFVTGHYQEAIKRFEETDLFTSGDIFQAEDNKLWWSTQNNKHAESAALLLLPNIDDFLKSYPDHLFNDFTLLALEDALKRNDLGKAEELQAAFRNEDRAVNKNSIEFFRGLYLAKNEEADKAVETWKKLTKDISDPYNRTRSEFALTVFQLDKKQIDIKQAIANLNSVRAIWRGGQLEFHILNLLGEFYMDNHQPMEGLRVWREAISAFPGSDESLLIAKKMSDNFIKIYSQGGVDKMPKVDAISLYYEFRELTPIGKLGDEMISKLVDMLIDVDLLDRATALLTHQVRFRLVAEERDVAATKLIKIHLINKDPQKAIDVLDATDNQNIKESIAIERRYLRSQALLELGKNNKVLTLLQDDLSKNAAFIRADVYWRNNVWRKVVDELEVPFREIRRDERKLTTDETNQLIKLAVSYALIDHQKRLQVLYEDFSGLIDDQSKKNLLTFIATNKGPVDYKNLEQTVEYKDMENFLNNYMKPTAESGKS